MEGSEGISAQCEACLAGPMLCDSTGATSSKGHDRGDGNRAWGVGWEDVTPGQQEGPLKCWARSVSDRHGEHTDLPV